MPPEHSSTTFQGLVTDLFGHRIVLADADKKILADLGPKGAQEINLAVGEKVTLTGEQKPSEVKVHSLSVRGQTYILEPGKGTQSGPNDERDEKTALAAVKAIGFEPLGKPSRHPKHFEIVGRRGDEHMEFHVALDGSIRKAKPAKPRGKEDEA